MSSYIDIDEFKRVDLRVGHVKTAEKIPGSEKLVKLIVDLGDLGERQIIAGLAKWYKPEDFIGKNIVVVVNIKPRKLMGYESQGMLLATDTDPPILIIAEKAVKPGSRLI
ncbi:MAG: methionine--tRNA ligase subunit beta [Desulfurococcaceae archaeon]